MGHIPSQDLESSFAAQGVFFHNASKRSVPHIFKFIALFLSVPCYHVSHFFFKRAYALQARQPKTLRPRVLSRRLGLDLQIVELLQPKLRTDYKDEHEYLVADFGVSFSVERFAALCLCGEFFFGFGVWSLGFGVWSSPSIGQ